MTDQEKCEVYRGELEELGHPELVDDSISFWLITRVNGASSSMVYGDPDSSHVQFLDEVFRPMITPKYLTCGKNVKKHLTQ